jgi:nicotinamide mononucleotide (NMN) deamidase PncC
VAGPGGTPYSDEIGISVIALSGPIDATVTIKTNSDNRKGNMATFTDRALQLLVNSLRSLKSIS